MNTKIPLTALLLLPLALAPAAVARNTTTVVGDFSVRKSTEPHTLYGLIIKDNHVGINVGDNPTNTFTVADYNGDNAVFHSSGPYGASILISTSVALTDHYLRVGVAPTPTDIGFLSYNDALELPALAVAKNNYVGINEISPQEHLHITGKMRYADGTQGVRKVLASDANGTAAWIVHPGDEMLSGDNTFTGKNTFSQSITGDITGNAATVTDGFYTTSQLAGDVTGTPGNTVVGNDSHSHTAATITSLNANVIDSGTVADARLSSAVTKQGNTFNGVSQLVQTDAAGKLPALDGSAITGMSKAQVGLGNVQNVDQTDASNLASGTVADARLTTAVTKQGNTFNGVSQLVQTDSTGKLPALDGSAITDMSKAQVGLGNVQNVDQTDASNLASGTVADARLSSAVTKQGNTFNGVSQLVQLDASGKLPAVDGSQLTGLPGGGDAFLSGAQTFTGQKTFTQPIIGSVTGNAATVTNGFYTNSQLAGAVTGTPGSTVVGNDSHSHTAATITSLNANVIDSGTVADARLSSAVTKQGNTFNGVSQLVQTDATGKLPALDGSAITGMSKAQVGLSNVQNVDQTDASNLASGTVADARLTTAVTKQGNAFNGVSQLVQTDSTGKLPALDGSAITGMSKAQVGLGNVQNVDQTDASNLASGTIADARLSSSVTKQGNAFNGVSQLVQTDVAGKLPALDGSAITGMSKTQVGLSNVQNVDQTDASNLASGTVADARLTTAVTKQGNTFNGVSQLVLTDSTGKLPALDGSAITGMSKTQVGLSNVQNVDQTDASNLASGTVADARLTTAVTKQGNAFNGVSQLVQTDSTGKLPALDGSAITGMSKTQVGLSNVHNVDQTDASNLASGTVADARLTTAVTKQGNAFNGISQLVQLDASGKLPAVDGSQLTGLPGGGDAFLSGAQTFTGQKTFTQPIIGSVTGNAATVTNGFYTTSQLAGDVTGTPGSTVVGDDSHAHTGATLSALNADTITTGTVADARLSSNITKAGNSFNGFGQLVMADQNGQIRLDGTMNWNYDNFVIRRSTANSTQAKMLSFLLGGDAEDDTAIENHWTFNLFHPTVLTSESTSGANTKLVVSGPSSVGFDINGNVGIGTVSPSYKLDVQSPSHPRLRIKSTDGSSSGIFIGQNDRLLSQIAVDSNDTYFDYGGDIGRLFFRSGVEGPAKITFGADGSIHSGNVNISGTSGTNYLQFPDGSKQYSAYSGNPAGAVITFAGATCPTGYLAANGAMINRTTYASLFSAISTTYGTGDGSTTFNLPDMRGYFVRGYDAGAGVDSGRTFGSKQADAFQGHTHSWGTGVYFWEVGIGTGGSIPSGANGQIVTDVGAPSPLGNGTPRVAAETRPVNIAMQYCIKY